MDDYYELVGVERTASREDIDRKIREQLRRWQRRTTNADLSRRQEAERRVQQLGQARIILLDEAKRRRYDRQLTANRASELPPTSGAGAGAGTATSNGAGGDAGTGAGVDATVAGNLLSQARGFLAANDHQAALYAARETLRATPNPPAETWTILARANSELGRLDDALFEARRATAADPNNPESHLALARVHERRQEWAEASRAYEAASRLDPRAETPHIGMAKALARAGRPGSALERLERHFTETADRHRGGRLLARGLVETAQVLLRPPVDRHAGRTTELAMVQRMLNRARQVASDAELLRRISALEQELARARARAAGAPTGPRYDSLRRDGGPVHHPPPAARTNMLAVVALVLALTGLVTCLTAPVGAILGHMARTQIQERGEQGDGAALTAIIVGWLVTALFCCGGFAIYANT